MGSISSQISLLETILTKLWDLHHMTKCEESSSLAASKLYPTISHRNQEQQISDICLNSRTDPIQQMLNPASIG